MGLSKSSVSVLILPSLGHLNRVHDKYGLYYCREANDTCSYQGLPASETVSLPAARPHPHARPRTPPPSPVFPELPSPSPGFPELRRSRHRGCQRRCPAPPPRPPWAATRPPRPAPASSLSAIFKGTFPSLLGGNTGFAGYLGDAAAISFVQLNGSRLHWGFPQVEGLGRRAKEGQGSNHAPTLLALEAAPFPALAPPPSPTAISNRRPRACPRSRAWTPGVRRGRAGPRGGAVPPAALSCGREVPTPRADGPEVGPSACGPRPLDVLCPPARDEPGAALLQLHSALASGKVWSRAHRLLFGLIRELL